MTPIYRWLGVIAVVAGTVIYFATGGGDGPISFLARELLGVTEPTPTPADVVGAKIGIAFTEIEACDFMTGVMTAALDRHGGDVDRAFGSVVATFALDGVTRPELLAVMNRCIELGEWVLP